MLRLDGARTVAVGPFNPFIITPEWLVANMVVDQHQPAGPNVKAMLDFSAGGVRWRVEGQSLEAESAAQDCGEPVARVIELLPHTPVWAVIHEFTYLADGEGWGGPRPVPQVGAVDPGRLRAEGAEAVRWVGRFSRPAGRRVELTFETELESNEVAVIASHHYVIQPRAKSRADEAVAHARQFSAARTDGEAMIRSVFGQEVSR